jgi:polysaccharide biosynthesis protein VpsM
MTRRIRFLMLATVWGGVMLGGFLSTTRAAESDTYGMKIGAGSRLILSLDTSTRYWSNYYFQEDDETSAFGLVVSPSALLTTDRGALRYQVGASAEAGAVDLEGDADDYVDGQVGGSFEWSPLTRHRLSGGASWRFDHDPFGTRRTEASGLMDRKLDRWEQQGANVVYHFGAPNATLNLETELSAFDREYQTNRDSTQFLDHDITALRGTVFYKISSKTSLLAEVIRAEIDYDNVQSGFPSRAGDLTRYRIGARWLATGKTTGTVKIGRLERNFDSSVQESLDEVDWEVAVLWEPRVRDRISFSTGRETEESYINAARIIDNQFYQLSWTHDWTGLLRSRVTYGFDDLDFRGINRQDDIQKLVLGLEYKPTRHWSLFGDISRRERDSSFVGRDYTDTAVTAGIRLTY